MFSKDLRLNILISYGITMRTEFKVNLFNKVDNHTGLWTSLFGKFRKCFNFRELTYGIILSKCLRFNVLYSYPVGVTVPVHMQDNGD